MSHPVSSLLKMSPNVRDQKLTALGPLKASSRVSDSTLLSWSDLSDDVDHHARHCTRVCEETVISSIVGTENCRDEAKVYQLPRVKSDAFANATGVLLT